MRYHYLNDDIVYSYIQKGIMDLNEPSKSINNKNDAAPPRCALKQRP